MNTGVYVRKYRRNVSSLTLFLLKVGHLQRRIKHKQKHGGYTSLAFNLIVTKEFLKQSHNNTFLTCQGSLALDLTISSTRFSKWYSKVSNAQACSIYLQQTYTWLMFVFGFRILQVLHVVRSLVQVILRRSANFMNLDFSRFFYLYNY